MWEKSDLHVVLSIGWLSSIKNHNLGLGKTRVLRSEEMVREWSGWFSQFFHQHLFLISLYLGFWHTFILSSPIKNASNSLHVLNLAFSQ